MIFITLLVIVVILHLVSIEEKEVGLVPEIGTAEENTIVSQRVCQFVNYSYRTDWHGWLNNIPGVLNPVLELTNTESKAGSFGIQLGFFLEEETPYDLFNGRLLFKDARFVSPRQDVWLEPGESMNVSIPTRAPFGQNHWAIGYIFPPTIEKCESPVSSQHDAISLGVRYVEKSSFKRITLFEKIFGFGIF